LVAPSRRRRVGRDASQREPGSRTVAGTRVDARSESRSELLITSRGGVTRGHHEEMADEVKCHCITAVGSRVVASSPPSWLKAARSSGTTILASHLDLHTHRMPPAPRLSMTVPWNPPGNNIETSAQPIDYLTAPLPVGPALILFSPMPIRSTNVTPCPRKHQRRGVQEFHKCLTACLQPCVARLVMGPQQRSKERKKASIHTACTQEPWHLLSTWKTRF